MFGDVLPTPCQETHSGFTRPARRIGRTSNYPKLVFFTAGPRVRHRPQAENRLWRPMAVFVVIVLRRRSGVIRRMKTSGMSLLLPDSVLVNVTAFSETDADRSYRAAFLARA